MQQRNKQLTERVGGSETAAAALRCAVSAAAAAPPDISISPSMRQRSAESSSSVARPLTPTADEDTVVGLEDEARSVTENPVPDSAENFMMQSS